MRKLRILLLLFVIATAAMYVAYTMQERKTSDYEAPIISADTDALRVSVAATDADLLAGLTAEDNLDGDVTDTLVVAAKGKFFAKDTRRVEYAAFDNNKNVGTYSREITYTDYTPPHFRLSEPLYFMEESNDRDMFKNLRAEDCLDGDITRQIKLNYGEYNAISEAVGEMRVILQVTNSAGDTAVAELTARKMDRATFYQQAPALREYIVYIQKGSTWDPLSYVSGIRSGGDTQSFEETEFTPEDVTIQESNLDRNKPGTYTVTFQLSQNAKVPLGSTELYVIVEG